MSSPAARAEARRKAILSRGSDRLAKLTTSGRGEDAPAYKHADPPLPKLSSLSNFVGDETPVLPPPSQNFGAPDPSVWSDEQQQQLMQALMMGRMPPNVRPDANASAKEGTPPPMPSLEETPFLAQLMAAAGGGDGGAGLGMGMNPMMGMNGPGPAAAVVRKPKTLVQKLLPLVHLVAMWLLLAYFVMFHEPKLHEAVGGLMDEQKDRVMNRWAALVKEVARVQVVPFFWALTTVQIVLHSTRLFTGLDNEQLPTLLSMAMPVLPPHIATIVVNGWKYIGLFSMLLDDLAGVLVGIGFIAWLATWFAVQ